MNVASVAQWDADALLKSVFKSYEKTLNIKYLCAISFCKSHHRNIAN